MSRASWGGQANLGDLFTSLVNQDFSAIKAGVNKAVNDANAQQAATDTEMQAKWTAGKISDQQWLDYIKQRIAGTTDPQQKAQWEQVLLQNQDAIVDAQWETKFQLNKITVSQLIQHYRSRMGAIATDSPAYRDLASRLTQLVQFQRQGGTYYSDSTSGGGSGGGGSSKAAGPSLSDIVAKGLKGGDTTIGYQGGEVYNTTGPDVVSVLFGKPTSNTYAGVANSAVDGLLGSANQLETFFQYLKDNPTASIYTDTQGHVIPINPNTIRAADDQYLRIKQTTAAVYYAKGDHSAGDAQLKDATDFVSTTMRDHNAAAVQPALDAMLAQTKATLVVASQEPDLNKRMGILKGLGQAWDNFATQVLPQDQVTGQVNTHITEGADTASAAGLQQKKVNTTQRLALENLVDPQTYQQVAGIRAAIDVAVNPSQYSDQQVSDLYDTLQGLPALGSGAAKLMLTDIFGGGGKNSTLGPGYTGTADTRVQLRGLNLAKQIESGQIPPSAAVDAAGNPLPLFTYQYNPQTGAISVVDAAVSTSNGVPTVVPAQGTQNGKAVAADNAVGFVTQLNGTPTMVYTPVDTTTPPAGYVYRFAQSVTINGIKWGTGDLVPSSVIASLGKNNMRQYLQNQVMVKAPLPGVKTAQIDGKTWYYDQRSNQWSPSVPWHLTADPTDPYAVQVDDPAYTYDSAGHKVIDPAGTGGDTSRIAMILTPGGTAYAVPFSGISSSQMQDWVNHQIAEGRLDPSQYYDPSPDGSSMEPAQMDNMYYSPNVNLDAWKIPQGADSGQVQNPYGDQGNAAADAIAYQKAKAADKVRVWETQVVGGQRGLWKTAQAQEVTDPSAQIMTQLQQYAKSLGIRTGDLNVLRSEAPGAAPAVARSAFADPSNPFGNYGPGIADFHADAFKAAANRLKVENQPRLAPLPAPPEPPPPPALAKIQANLDVAPVDTLQSVPSNIQAISDQKRQQVGRGVTKGA